MTKAGLEHETRLITWVPLGPISRAAPAGTLPLLDPLSGDPTPSSGSGSLGLWDESSAKVLQVQRKKDYAQPRLTNANSQQTLDLGSVRPCRVEPNVPPQPDECSALASRLRSSSRNRSLLLALDAAGRCWARIDGDG